MVGHGDSLRIEEPVPSHLGRPPPGLYTVIAGSAPRYDGLPLGGKGSATHNEGIPGFLKSARRRAKVTRSSM